MLAAGHALGAAARADVDEGRVHVAQGAAPGVGVAAVWPQLANQLAVDCPAPHGGHGHPHARHAGRGQVLEGAAVPPRVVVLVAQVGRPRVVAGPGGAVLARALVALAAHGLRVGVCGLVAAAHALPLPQPATDDMSP